jgi:transposase
MSCLGIDVSKETLSCFHAGVTREFPNSRDALDQVKAFAPDADSWCMEATGRYHLRVAGYGVSVGKTVLVVNPGRAKKYLSFVSDRVKSDAVDARSLSRLGEREGENLRKYRPITPAVVRARDLMAARRVLVQSRVSLGQVRLETGDEGGHLQEAIAAADAAEKAIRAKLADVLKDFPAYRHLLEIPGVGPLSAAVAVCTLERGEFATSDALVAYAGLDPRVRESGTFRGKRKLSHQGDAELRTIIFMAARAGARTETWKDYYQKQLDKGLSTTAATAILARKMLRLIWAVYKQNRPYIPKSQMALDNKT